MEIINHIIVKIIDPIAQMNIDNLKWFLVGFLVGVVPMLFILMLREIRHD